MKTLHVDIVTPTRTAFGGDVQSITIPGTLGSFQVLYNHAPLMSSFEIGQIKIEEAEDKKKLYATSGGTVEVLNNKVVVLAESFESPEEIDVERAKAAMERAKKRMARETNEESIDILRAELALRRAINRLKLVNKL
ncbi:ATP synthase epsilon chain [hydrothermal vent metagenome]|uniref:ATP synthase epsilon chain n=1 Tax=hydrothermal vent metagenome TaxID=652676 RepID=A0A3B1DJR1_9ZZZZ